MSAYKPLLNAFKGKQTRIPIWFMRQAGRYLPEYRAIREQNEDFIQCCLDEEIATEITLQPIRRFDIDAAIIFSDIMVLPYALGIPVKFIPGEGPTLPRYQKDYDFRDLHSVDSHDFRKVQEKIGSIISKTSSKLRTENPKAALIGFVGAPWTLMCYILGIRAKEHVEARRWCYDYPSECQQLIDILVHGAEAMLCAQIEAGAEVVKIFDSHAGVLSERMFRELVIEPTARIVSAVKQRHPGVPIIGFPRGAGNKNKDYALLTGVDGMAIDHTVSLQWAKENLQQHKVVQGNLDNALMTSDFNLQNQSRISEEVQTLLDTLWSSTRERFILNLGHGMLPSSKIEHIHRLIEAVREYETRSSI